MTNARKSRAAAQEKAAQMRLEQARRERNRRIWIVAGAAVVVVAVAAGVTLLVLNENDKVEAGSDLSAVQSFGKPAANHVQTPVKYAQTPPVGGDHSPVWLNCGIYDKPVPNENAVHDLEHGAVWITYRPDLPKADVDKLKDVVGTQTYITMSPFEGLPAPVVASAWGKQLKLTGAGDARLRAFIKEYKQGPQTPEPGAACTGGVGTPTG
jgi:hypothetical protein